MGKLFALLSALGLWWDARHNPDPRTEAVAALAVSGAESSATMADEIAALRAEVRALKARQDATERRTRPKARVYGPEVAPEGYKAPRGWLSRLLGNSGG